MNSELWRHAGRLCEDARGGLHHVVNGDGHVIGADLIGQSLGPVLSVRGGIGACHVASCEQQSENMQEQT